MRLAPCFIVVAATVACTQQHRPTAERGVQVVNAPLAFPRTFIGHPTIRSIELVNSAAVARTATLSVGAPYSAAVAVSVEPGGRLRIPVTFAPTAPGTYLATAEVRSEGKTIAVDLMGVGELAPPCTGGSACAREHFDPAAGRCVTDTAPDWTACGAASCTLAHVCLGGSCRAVTPPDGFECAPSTPCQSHGTCQAGSCVKGPLERLPIAWSIKASVPRGDDGPALVDPVGNVYWRDSKGLVSVTRDGHPRVDAPSAPQETPLAVSEDLIFTTDGSNLVARRSGDLGEQWRFSFSRDQLSQCGVSGATSCPRVPRRLAATVSKSTILFAVSWEISAPGDTYHYGESLLRLFDLQTGAPRGEQRVTRALVTAVARPDRGFILSADDTAYGPLMSRLWSIDEQLQTDWDQGYDHTFVMRFWSIGSRLVWSTSRAFELSDGGTYSSIYPLSTAHPSPVLFNADGGFAFGSAESWISDDGQTLFATSAEGAASQTSAATLARGLDLDAGAVTFSVTFGDALGAFADAGDQFVAHPLALTKSHDVLLEVSRGPDAGAPDRRDLVLLRADGGVGFVCPFSQGDVAWDQATLRNGRLYADARVGDVDGGSGGALIVYDLPGLDALQ